MFVFIDRNNWGCATSTPPSLRVSFLEYMLTADLDFALVFSGLGEIIGKLHP